MSGGVWLLVKMMEHMTSKLPPKRQSWIAEVQKLKGQEDGRKDWLCIWMTKKKKKKKKKDKNQRKEQKKSRDYNDMKIKRKVQK